MTNLQYALRFISGKYQGSEFPLRMDREVVVGRGSDVDMVLVEDMVSRRHARIVSADSVITIHDLDSTNGTFVNGEKVREARLKEGDRILIGTSILRLVAADASQPVLSDAEAKRRLEQTGRGRQTSSISMSGLIDEIPLPDLMQLLSTSRKSGVLVVHHSEHGDGRIFFRRGQIYYATIDDAFDLHPRKAIWRMLGWTSGTFTLEPPDEQQVLEEISDSTEGLLMEGMRQLDELERAAGGLPRRGAALALPLPLDPPLRALTPEELDTLQAALNAGTVRAFIDRHSKTDLDALLALKSFIDRDYLVAK